MNTSLKIGNKFFEPNSTATFFIFYIFMGLTSFLSLFLNSWSIYVCFKIRKKISADYIKIQIFFINIIFTIIAIPYYISRENKHLKSIFICKTLYSVTDFIMFVYNNLLILMAIDRFVFICTRIRFNLKLFYRIFYTITILISSTSLSRLLMNDCYDIIFESYVPNCLPFFPKFSFFCFKEHVIFIYNYFIVFVIGFNWILTSSLYIIIIRFVYKNTLIGHSYKFLLVNNSEFRKLNKKNNSKIKNKIFTSSKHWEITKTFIKVRKLVKLNVMIKIFF